MIKLFSSLIIAAGLALLTGCGPIYQTTYTYRPPKTSSGKQCVNQCLWHKNTCQRRCNARYSRCMADAQDDANYRKKRCRRHGGRHCDQISANTSQCTQNCGCNDTYNQCFQNCGGIIVPHRVCEMFCNQKPS